MVASLKIKLFADGADADRMIELARDPRIKGFTTNPSLMKAAGVTDYERFARRLMREIPDHPISFEVFSDEHKVMGEQARRIAGWGENAVIKIPITNSHGVSSRGLIQDLQHDNIRVNVTAVFTLTQVRLLAEVLDTEVPSIVSVFAGRIADTGVDPQPLMTIAKRELHGSGAALLWASTREILNIVQADQAGADIITVPYALLRKLSLLGKDHIVYSQETVREFYRDAKDAGYAFDAEKPGMRIGVGA